MDVASLDVSPLAARSARGLAAALARGGWEPATAASTAAGMAPAAFRIVGLDDTSLEALVHFGGQLGLDVITGAGWAVISGARSRVSALARPWTVPEPLRELAYRLGIAMPADLPAAWRTARGAIALDGPVLMGILNVTPDSFSDGGRYAGVEPALQHAARLLDAGAAILDIGGESTRPGRAAAVSPDEELRRIVPVVTAVANAFPGAFISIDTMKAEVARAALDAGAAIVNDVTGLRHDARLGAATAAAGAALVLMHSRGAPLELASLQHTDYGGDVVGGVAAELRTALARAAEAGVAEECLAIDPGLGFSKTAEQNLLMLDQLDALSSLGRPVLVGPSRKRFLGAATGRDVGARDTATAAACALAFERGARIFRVHDVATARDALAVAAALGHSPPGP